MALRLALISPRGPLYRHKTGIWKKQLRYAPLTLTTLASLIPNDLEVDLTLIDEGIQEINVNQDFDLVGISTITGTAPRAYELSNVFRQRGIPVVLGGVHPTLVPDEAQQHADSIVVGYAEERKAYRLLNPYTNNIFESRHVQFLKNPPKQGKR